MLRASASSFRSGARICLKTHFKRSSYSIAAWNPHIIAGSSSGDTCLTHHNHHHCFQQVRTKVFVSRHNTLHVTAQQIIEHCQSNGISANELRQNTQHVMVRECPFCNKPTNGKADNEYKLYVQVGGGAYYCHRCGAKGSWYDFKMKLGGYEVVGMDGKPSSSSMTTTRQGAVGRGSTSSAAAGNNGGSGRQSRQGSTAHCLPMPSERLAACYITNLVDQPAKNNDALDYLTRVRGLDKTTLRKYGVGRATYNFPSSDKAGGYVPAECVTFPWIMRASEVKDQEELRGATFEPAGVVANDNDDDNSTARDPFVTRRIKARALENKGWQRLDPPGGGWGLFGFHTIPPDATEIVITEGEYDAMAVYQATGRPAVSLPSGCRNLPVEVLPMLERFEKVYLWMDNDGPGQEGAEKFANKIGLKRCFIVKPTSLGEHTPKDANEALLAGLDLNEMLEQANLMEHEFIVDFKDLRSQVLHEIVNPDKYTGVGVKSLPAFTDIIKGFRRGEVTVLTGPTGSGKTTFLGQVSLDFAEQGINTLWGSFEIKNTRLMHKLLQQFSREPLPVGQPDKAASLEALADRFQSLPLYFMKFHGGSDVDDVLNAMDYATYVHDVEHIILDNMQFMISRKSHSSSFDKFDVQDVAIEKFRKFATEKNVHVTLVVHPRKEDEGTRLNISSIYGSAKATQEADTVLILQNDGRRKYVEVKKNRFDGTLGTSPLYFERKSGRYVEQMPGGGREPSVNGQARQNATFPKPKISSITTRKATPEENIDGHWADILAGGK